MAWRISFRSLSRWSSCLGVSLPTAIHVGASSGLRGRLGTVRFQSRDVVDSTMLGAQYNEHSQGQIVAHNVTHAAVSAALRRLVQVHGGPGKALRISDLGCASGANGMVVATSVKSALHAASCQSEVCYALNDLPSNDWAALTSEILAAKLQNDRFHVSFVPRSFYEPLFPRASQHLSLSYITLHWQPAPACDLGPTAAQPNEAGAPPEKVALWRVAAHESLVKFLRLRAAELVDGGEGIYLMVTHSEWFTPRGGKPSIFRTAIDRAVRAGDLSPEMAARATINHYFRSQEEVEKSAAEVPEVELLDVRSTNIQVAEGMPAESNAGLAWAIHANSLQTSMGAPEGAMEAIRKHFSDVVAEEFGSQGTPHRYTYLHVSRRPREVQS